MLEGSMTQDFHGDIRNFVFIASVVDTGDKLVSGVNNTSSKLSSLSFITPVIINRQ
jgi:hypothetical protein